MLFPVRSKKIFFNSQMKHRLENIVVDSISRLIHRRTLVGLSLAVKFKVYNKYDLSQVCGH